MIVGKFSIVEDVVAGDNSLIGNNSVVQNVKLGKESKIWHFCNVYSCEIGENTQIGSYCQIKPKVIIGNHCRIQDGVSIPEETKIGNYVFIGPRVVFSNDKFPTAKKTLDRTYLIEPVVVEDYVTIGAGVKILAGVRIGRKSYLGLGSVVIKDVPANAIVVGNPAKVVGFVTDDKYSSYKIDEEYGKKILFNLQSSNPHTIWKETIQNPPEGYSYVLSKNPVTLEKIGRFKNRPWLVGAYKKTIRRVITPIQLAQRFVSIPKDIDLVYSPELPIMQKVPWVCDLETAYSLAGHNHSLFQRKKKKLENLLASSYCKKIMPFTNFGRQTFEREFDISRFQDKIEVVHFAANIPKMQRKRDSRWIDMIFVGTANQTDPQIFYMKGGREAIEAFKMLSKRYKNLRLKIISNVPSEVNIAGIKNLEILPLMPRDKLYELYASSHIFLAPTYLNLGLSFVEAMGNSLPIITNDLFGLPDAVDKNGLLINVPNKGEYAARAPGISELPSFTQQIFTNNYSAIVDGIVKNVSTLVEKPSLIKKMGAASREKYENEFSMEYRNKKLKKIFDDALAQ